MDCEKKGFLSRERSDECSSSSNAGSIGDDEWSISDAHHHKGEESNTPPPPPHMMASLLVSKNIPTIDLPPPSLLEEETTTIESTHPKISPSPSSTTTQFQDSPISDPCLMSTTMTNLSNFHISVTDMDLDEDEEEEELLNMKRTYDDKTQQTLSDDKENIAPTLLFHHNVESPSLDAQSSSFKPPSKTNQYQKSAFDVPFSMLSTNVPFQHRRNKRVGNSDVLTRSQKQNEQPQSKRLHRSSLHRRVSCDSLPDLSTLQLSSMDLLSNGIKPSSNKSKQQASSSSFGGGADGGHPPPARRAAAVARPNLRRHWSMSATMGFR